MSSSLDGSYSILGLTISKSLWLHGVGVAIFVIGTGREIVAMRRGTGHLLAHALRILAYVLAASFFFVAVKYLAEANPQHWSVALSWVLILAPACMLILTGRAAAPNRRGRHADRSQESKIEAR